MAVLSENISLTEEIGDQGALPVKASTIVYAGAMTSLASGYAEPLTKPNKFGGHATKKADNSAGSAGDINVTVKSGRYRLEVDITATAADHGAIVYASDDNTYTLTSTGNTIVGVLVRITGTNIGIVEFRPLP